MGEAYNRLFLYGAEGLVYSELLERVNYYLQEMPNVMFENRVDELETYKKYNMIIATFSLVVQAGAIFAILISLSYQMVTKIKLNMPKYALLRINGLSLGKIKKLCFMQWFLLYLIGITIAVPISVLSVNLSFDIWGAEFLKYYKVMDISILVITMISIFVISYIPAMKIIEKMKINEELNH